MGDLRQQATRTLDRALATLLAATIAWFVFDFFIAVRVVDYFVEKPVRLLPVIGFTAWFVTCMVLFVSKRHNRPNDGT